jgi:transcriptional regulator with XRE-family HTH domain
MTPKQKRDQLKKASGVRSAAKVNEKREVSELGTRLKAWREKNGLSQRQAEEVMKGRGVPIDIRTIQQWEQGLRRPSGLAVHAVADFFERFSTISDAPTYGKRSKFSAEDVAEIRRLKEEGETLVAIGERFGVDQSYISRICSGERLAKGI